MDFSLSDEQRMLTESVRKFIQGELEPLEDEVEETGQLAPEKAVEIFKKSQALGFYNIWMPEELGGGGISTLDWCLVEEQLGHTTDILCRRAFGTAAEVLNKCTPEQKKRWAVPTVKGERTGSIAMTEPNAGSDAAGIKTQAIAEGDGWRLTGGKHFISDGAYSDYFIVSAVTDPKAGSKGISAFLVDKASPGFSVGRDQAMMGLRGTSCTELFFDGVRLEREHLIGAEGQGLRLVLETLGRVRLTQVGARAVGKATKLLELMSSYAQERRQFGQAIGQFQLIQEMIADSTIEVNAARLMVLRAAWEIDQGREGREWISMIKVHAAEVLGRVADRAVQVFGGMGWAREMPIERLYRDARVYRIFDGTSEIHRSVIARSVLKKGRTLFDIG